MRPILKTNSRMETRMPSNGWLRKAERRKRQDRQPKTRTVQPEHEGGQVHEGHGCTDPDDKGDDKFQNAGGQLYRSSSMAQAAGSIADAKQSTAPFQMFP